MQFLAHPEEIPSLLRIRYSAYLATKLPNEPNLAFCYDMLNCVSRSFAVVIQQLGSELRDAVCIFYLVLRALDTIEDDMSIPVESKIPELHSFHEHIYDPSYHFICGVKDYKRLMTRFEHVSEAFLALNKRYQIVIQDITRQMGEGMAKYITKEVDTVQEYNEYCHYVAGLVGIGLSDLFAAAKLEEPVSTELSNSMGLFLQKTNIIRDYLEDIQEEPAPRMFWPKQIWGKYASHLEDFKELRDGGVHSVMCLNDLITDALQHASDSLTYMGRLRDEAVFRFCAIPQIMAMGTLALCYGNVGVYQGVVKLRKGLSCKIMDKTKTMANVYSYFERFSDEILKKIDLADPNSDLTKERVDTIKRRCKAGALALQSRDGLHPKQNRGRLCFQTLWWILAVLGILVLGLPHFKDSSRFSEIARSMQETHGFSFQIGAFILIGATTIGFLCSA